MYARCGMRGVVLCDVPTSPLSAMIPRSQVSDPVAYRGRLGLGLGLGLELAYRGYPGMGDGGYTMADGSGASGDAGLQ